MPRLRRCLAVALAAATTSAAFTVVAPAAPAAAASGEVVLEPWFPADLPKVTYLDGSSGGLAWQLNARTLGGGRLRYLPVGAPGQTISELVDNRYVSVVGDQIALVADDPGSEEDDVHVSSGPLVAIDLPTGTRTELAGLEVGANFRGGTGDGWLRQSGGIVRKLTATGQTRTYAWPAGVTPTSSAATKALDDRGAVFWLRTGSGTAGVLAYLDFASGAWTTLDTGAAGYAAQKVVELDGDVVAWPRGESVAWLDRAEPGTVHTQKVAGAGGTIADIAIAAGTVALTSRAPDAAGTSVLSVRIGTLGGTWKTVTSAAHKLGDQVTAVGGGALGVLAGSTTADFGVYRLTPGSSALGAAVALFGPNAPSPITASVGELQLGPVRKGGDPVVRKVTTDAAVSALTVGPPTVQPGKAVAEGCERQYESWVVCKTWGNDDGIHLVVRHDDRVVGDYPVGDAWPDTTLTGHGLFFSDTARESGTPMSQLIDLDTGRRTRLPYSAAINGDDLYYVTAEAEIIRRNLVTGAETTLREPGPPISSDPFDLREVTVEVSGDWVRWFFHRYPNWQQPPLESVALNLKTGQRYDFTSFDLGHYAPATLFAAGSLAWTDDEKNVHFMNLTKGHSRIVGKSDPANIFGGRTIALTAEFLAWMDADYRIHLLPLGEVDAGTPRLGGVIDENGFSPADGPYDPQGDTNRPLSAWTMTIRAAATPGVASATAAGAAVRTLKGSARTGEVRPAWDGKDASGRKVADGVYTWTLTGTGAGGGLTVAAGGAKPITGTVRLDSSTPVPVLTLARTAARSAPANGLALKWSSAERGVRFTVKVQVGTRDRKGVLRWSKATYWRKATTSTSGRYGAPGTWVPYEVRNGRSYRFTVTAVDAIGNTRTVTKTVEVPK